MEVTEKIESKVISTARKKILLIVDDSDFIRERLVALCSDIENIGAILQAKNSEQAYSLFYSASPDVVILDIHIPGDNGIKVLENIRMKNKAVKILILTDYPYDQYRKKCMELGADCFFEKSGDINRMLEICEIFIADNDLKQMTTE